MGLSVVIFGGSGFLGQGLRERLVRDNHSVIVVGRGTSTQEDGWRNITWDAKTLGPWADSLENADVVVHMAGKRVDCRPTKSNTEELISSREGTVKLVGDAIERLNNPPKAWVQLSSLAVFGDSGDRLIDEDSAPPESGLTQQVEVTQRWEAAFHSTVKGLDRSVLLRPGVNIGGTSDPVTIQLARLARWGLGGKVGNGKQWVSWIGSQDFFHLLHRSVVEQSVSGLYHLTSPNPVQNHELMKSYREALGRQFGLPSSRLLTTIGAWALGSDPALALSGRRCVPSRLLNEGYEFKQPGIQEAVSQAVRDSN